MASSTGEFRRLLQHLTGSPGVSVIVKGEMVPDLRVVAVIDDVIFTVDPQGAVATFLLTDVDGVVF